MLLDLRTAAEYKRGHIPQAISFPFQITLSNWGKALPDIASPRWEPWKKHLARFLRKQNAPWQGLQAYCQTGTWKSPVLAQLGRTLGYAIEVLSGGYRGYLDEQVKFFKQPFCLLVLAGETGTGKTELLQALARCGEPTIDLEALAGHRGSVFGALGHTCQPTNQQFKNDLMSALQALDLRQSIWIEDEACALGRAGIPENFWQQMRTAPCFKLTRPISERVQRIVREYGGFEIGELANAIKRLAPRLGKEVAAVCLDLAQDRLGQAVGYLLHYYDPAYARQLQAREKIREIPCGPDTPSALALKLKTARQKQKK